MEKEYFGKVTRSTVFHRGNGKGHATIDFEDDETDSDGFNRLHRFIVPYSFPLGPDGIGFKFHWEETTYEGDEMDEEFPVEIGYTPEQVKEEAVTLREDAKKKANY